MRMAIRISYIGPHACTDPVRAGFCKFEGCGGQPRPWRSPVTEPRPIVGADHRAGAPSAHARFRNEASHRLTPQLRRSGRRWNHRGAARRIAVGSELDLSGATDTRRVWRVAPFVETNRSCTRICRPAATRCKRACSPTLAHDFSRVFRGRSWGGRTMRWFNRRGLSRASVGLFNSRLSRAFAHQVRRPRPGANPRAG